MIAVIPFFIHVVKVPPSDMANSLSAVYLMVLGWAVYDNDFSKRKKYGIPERVFFNKKAKKSNNLSISVTLEFYYDFGTT